MNFKIKLVNVLKLSRIDVLPFKLHRCRTALVQVLQKGGLPSLYAGWGAVLCRNVPHSVIKVRALNI